MYSVDDCLFEGEHAARKLMYQYQQMKRTIDKIIRLVYLLLHTLCAVQFWV